MNCALARVRSGPGTTYQVVGMLAQSKGVTILEQVNGWYKIEEGNLHGWISASLINQTTTNKVPTTTVHENSTVKVYVNGNMMSFDVNPLLEDGRTLVPLRTIFESMGASVKWDDSSKKVTASKAGTTIILTIGSLNATVNGKVQKLDVPAKIVNGRTLAPLRFVGEALGAKVSWDGENRVIHVDYSQDQGDASTPVGSEQVSAPSSGQTPSRSGGPNQASRLLEKAAEYLHTPYKFGGQTPAGFDCSGFVQYVFGQFGYKLPRVASAQALIGVSVSKSDLMPGDLVFFNIDGSGISHVGIYVGNGKFIGASSQESGGVIYSSLSDKYYAAKYAGARRVLK
ncbi:MAG TPA: stalk domain-containing protein [Syntrophomonadaceae bacterium]|nr:stalk domain-containing protein [Syntrophomonadaceae bacterium]